jgi:hypothetical protein
LVVQGPPSLIDTVRSGAALITDAIATAGGDSCRIDALERTGSGPAAPYRPILFVRRRATIRTPFTEAGIRDYLVLLSLYQTLRYRQASFWKFLLSSFWKFLLSDQTDIEHSSA